jgi:post-segregation antitoxin (ccd killing protein)
MKEALVPINLRVSFEDKELAKNKGINMSDLFRNILKAEIRLADTADATSKEELINKLKGRVGKLTSELSETSSELKETKRKLTDLQADYDLLKTKFEKDKDDRNFMAIKSDDWS